MNVVLGVIAYLLVVLALGATLIPLAPAISSRVPFFLSEDRQGRLTPPPVGGATPPHLL